MPTVGVGLRDFERFDSFKQKCHVFWSSLVIMENLQDTKEPPPKKQKRKLLKLGTEENRDKEKEKRMKGNTFSSFLSHILVIMC